MTFGFIISVYVGVLVLAMLARGRRSEADRVDDTNDGAYRCDVVPDAYSEQAKKHEKAMKDDLACDGDLHGLF